MTKEQHNAFPNGRWAASATPASNDNRLTESSPASLAGGMAAPPGGVVTEKPGVALAVRLPDAGKFKFRLGDAVLIRGRTRSEVICGRMLGYELRENGRVTKRLDVAYFFPGNGWVAEGELSTADERK